jgi:hypothetical protein
MSTSKGKSMVGYRSIFNFSNDFLAPFTTATTFTT